MRTRAKIEEEIAALATEVHELVRSRGAGLPDVDTLVEFIWAVFGYERARELAEAADSRGMAWIGEAVGELQLAPAAETLRSCVVAACQAVDHNDPSAFKRVSQQLRQSLIALLEVRAQKWWRLQAASQFYPPSWQSTADPAEHVRAKVSKLTRWEVLVWAGNALACATEDVWLWWLWQSGWREYREAQHARDQKTTQSEALWQREVVEHTLPGEEALIVDSWPVPPDDQWPDRNTRELTLPRLRKWQAQQAGAGAVAEQTSSDQEQQR